MTRSHAHLRALAQAYPQAHGRKLSSALENEFSGHMKSALRFIATGVENDGDGIYRDVELLEDSMKGLGTKDEKLSGLSSYLFYRPNCIPLLPLMYLMPPVYRVIRSHWNRSRFENIKRVYEQKFGKSLLARVRGETSGNYGDFMMAVISSSGSSTTLYHPSLASPGNFPIPAAPPAAPPPAYGAPQPPPVVQYDAPSPQIIPISVQPPRSPRLVPPIEYATPVPEDGPLLYLGVLVPPPPPAPPISDTLPGFDARRTAEVIRKAMKGFGTDTKALTGTIAPLDAMQVDVLRRVYESTAGKNLVKAIEKETSSWYEYALRAKILGPVLFDCWLLHRGSAGLGTHEDILTEILLDRTNSEMRTLKTAYRATYQRDLTAIIRSELSAKTERLFAMALVANRDETEYVDQARVQADVKALYEAGEGQQGTDEITM
ncbi:hypothetical protein BU17DRAFT_97597 [Hysterangium stoloniferum]|nr:hypothetical protein BU17DRAFT_97597 [Hysterangium stoloniferum]